MSSVNYNLKRHRELLKEKKFLQSQNKSFCHEVESLVADFKKNPEKLKTITAAEDIIIKLTISSISMLPFFVSYNPVFS